MSKKSIKLITCDRGDWEVLKLNGEVYYESHRIPNFIWLELLDEMVGTAQEICISDEDMKMGNYYG